MIQRKLNTSKKMRACSSASPLRSKHTIRFNHEAEPDNCKADGVERVARFRVSYVTGYLSLRQPSKSRYRETQVLRIKERSLIRHHGTLYFEFEEDLKKNMRLYETGRQKLERQIYRQ